MANGGGLGTYDAAKEILSPLQINNSLKADAWEAFNSSKNETDLQVKLMSMKDLPQTAKADLWEAKHRSPEGKMGNSPNVPGLIADERFQGLSPADKRLALQKVTGDSDFALLSDAETMQFVSRFARPKPDIFDQVAAQPQSKGDIFDQVAAQSQSTPIQSTTTIGPPASLGQRLWGAAKQGPVALGEEMGRSTVGPLLRSTARVPGTGVTVGQATKNAQQMIGMAGREAAMLYGGPGAAETLAAKVPNFARAVTTTKVGTGLFDASGEEIVREVAKLGPSKVTQLLSHPAVTEGLKIARKELLKGAGIGGSVAILKKLGVF